MVAVGCRAGHWARQEGADEYCAIAKIDASCKTASLQSESTGRGLHVQLRSWSRLQILLIG
jgi:hypothetical protein